MWTASVWIIHAVDLIARLLLSPNEHIDTKWRDISEELETSSYKSKILLLLVGKHRSVPC